MYALREMGWSMTRIADHLGFAVSTVWSHLQKPLPPEQEARLEKLRDEQRRKWVEDAWKIVLDLNTIVKKKIKMGHTGFKDAKEAATVMGIYLDKMAAMEQKIGRHKDKPSVVINIMPPSGGDLGRSQVDGNTIQVLDASESVYGDDSGRGLGQDICALPEGRKDGAGEPEVEGDDYSLDLPQSQ